MIRTCLAAFTISLLCALGGSEALGQDTTPETHRFLLVVANNTSFEGRSPPLKYADDDGARFYELLAPGTRMAVLLTTFDAKSQEHYPHLTNITQPPTHENLMRSLAALRKEISASKQQGHRTVLHVYFAGHGEVSDKGMGYFSLADDQWTREEMLKHIATNQLPDFTHIIVDTCNAYFLIHDRGDWEQDAEDDALYSQAVSNFLNTPPQEKSAPQTGYMLATTSARKVHEWDVFEGGVFSHQLRSALVGAADVNGDGHLQYDEIHAYITAANFNVKNPKARISSTAYPPRQNLKVPFLSAQALRPETVLKIPAGLPGRFVLRDERDMRYADITTTGDRPLNIALVGKRTGVGFSVGVASYDAGDDPWEIQHEAAIDLVKTEIDVQTLQTYPPQTPGARSVGIREAFRSGLFAKPFSADFYDGHAAALRDRSTQTAPPTNPSPWHLAVGYGLGQALNEGSLEHALELGVRYGQRSGVFGHLGLEGGLSRSSFGDEPVDATLWRLNYHVGGGYAFPLIGETLVAGLHLGLGQLATLENPDNGVLKGDLTGMRGHAQAFGLWSLDDTWSIGLSVGSWLNTISVLKTDDPQNPILKEELLNQFGGRLQMLYTF